MIDFTKQNICDGCDIITSENNPIESWTITIGYKKISLSI